MHKRERTVRARACTHTHMAWHTAPQSICHASRSRWTGHAPSFDVPLLPWRDGEHMRELRERRCAAAWLDAPRWPGRAGILPTMHCRGLTRCVAQQHRHGRRKEGERGHDDDELMY